MGNPSPRVPWGQEGSRCRQQCPKNEFGPAEHFKRHSGDFVMHCTSPKNHFRVLGSGRSYWGNKLLTLNSHNFFDTWNWGLKLYQSTQNRELRRSTGSKPISRLRRCSPQGVGIGRGTRGACSETVANIDENLLKFRCFLSSQISAPRLGFFYQTFSRSVVKRRL